MKAVREVLATTCLFLCASAQSMDRERYSSRQPPIALQPPSPSASGAAKSIGYHRDRRSRASRLPAQLRLGNFHLSLDAIYRRTQLLLNGEQASVYQTRFPAPCQLHHSRPGFSHCRTSCGPQFWLCRGDCAFGSDASDPTSRAISTVRQRFIPQTAIGFGNVPNLALRQIVETPRPVIDATSFTERSLRVSSGQPSVEQVCL